MKSQVTWLNPRYCICDDRLQWWSNKENLLRYLAFLMFLKCFNCNRLLYLLVNPMMKRVLTFLRFFFTAVSNLNNTVQQLLNQQETKTQMATNWADFDVWKTSKLIEWFYPRFNMPLQNIKYDFGYTVLIDDDPKQIWEKSLMSKVLRIATKSEISKFGIFK